MNDQLEKDSNPEQTFSMGKKNYRLLIIGCLIVAVGFILMSGGKSTDPEIFNPEIFSARRITVAPLTVFFGYMFVIYAILAKP